MDESKTKKRLVECSYLVGCGTWVFNLRGQRWICKGKDKTNGGPSDYSTKVDSVFPKQAETNLEEALYQILLPVSASLS